MLAELFTSDNASRFLAVAVLLFSAVSAVVWGRRWGHLMVWHCGWVAVWSLVAAWGMLALATDVPMWDVAAVEALNVAWSCVLIGWVSLLYRRVPL